MAAPLGSLSCHCQPERPPLRVGLKHSALRDIVVSDSHYGGSAAGTGILTE